jgi:hypothetical protein
MKPVCNAPDCYEMTHNVVDFWSCTHSFYFCDEHMYQFSSVVSQGHTGHCSKCGTEFKEDTVGILWNFS